MTSTTQPTEAAEAKPDPVCPFCRSQTVTTPTANFDTSGYWRCEKCGEMWNVGRHKDQRRQRDTPFWR